jgi:hypothetical protein
MENKNHRQRNTDFVYILCQNYKIKKGKKRKMGRVGTLLTGLTPSPFCVCSKLAPGFPTSYLVVFFMFSDRR